MSRRYDPEIDELFAEPGLRDVARLMSLTQAPEVRPDPAFRSDLRRRLMQQAWAMNERPRSFWAGLFAPQRLALAGGLVGVVLIGLVAILVMHPGGSFQEVLPPTSPLDNAQQVSVVKPIELDFNQPMNHQSVEQAVQVAPATPLKFDWKGNTVFITPVTGTLAPNTQYQVTVAPTAVTANNQPVTQAKVITFVTQPAPTPRPTITPSPSATPSLVSDEKALAPIGQQAAQWSADGATLYLLGPDGKLGSVPAAGGDVKVLATGVKLFTLGPAGPIFQRAGGIDAFTPGGTVEPLAANANAVALGVRQGKLVYVEGKQVHATGVQQLAETPSAAWFSPSGERLAYQAPTGFHVFDLASAHDVVLNGATAFLAWSPDGLRFAYQGADGVYTTGDGSAAVRVSSLAASGLAWSQRDELLIASPNALSLVNADGNNLRTLAAGDYGQPGWSPAAGTFSFVRGGQLYAARTAAAQTGPAAQLDEVLKLVDSFVKARIAGATDQANAFLDPAAKDYPDPTLKPARYFVILAQPGQATVRLVLGDKKEESAVDETLYLQRAANGTLLIHKVTASPPRLLGKGPELLSVKVSSDQLQVEFDSFLDPAAISGVVVSDAAGKPVLVKISAKDRMVTVAIPGGLASGASYQLGLNAALTDVNGHKFNGAETVQLLGP